MCRNGGLHQLVRAAAIAACAVPAGAIEDIWLTGVEPFTGFPIGFPCMEAGEVMVDEVNKNPNLLPGYRLRVAWQDGGCSGAVSSELFLNNVFKEKYFEYSGDVSAPHERDNADLNGGPVGMIGGGCSGSSKAITQVAYMANFPMVSGTSSFPGLSKRSDYPNFWRTILPDTKCPAAWMTIAKLFGFTRMTPVIGETSAWASMAEVMVSTATDKGVTLHGADLSDVTTGFKGYQASLDSKVEARVVAEGIRSQNNRFVMVGLYDARSRLILCEAHKLGLDNIIFTFLGWLPIGWWDSDATDCPKESLNRIAWGLITAQMQKWRPEATMDTVLGCSTSMTGRQWWTEWLSRNNMTEYAGTSPMGHSMTTDAVPIADAVCMYAKALHTLLITESVPLADLQQRKASVYDRFQELFLVTDFEGVTGRITFKPGSPDPEGSIQVQHLQASTSAFVDIGSVSAAGVLTFSGQADFMFKLPGETFAAGPAGATTINNAQLAAFLDCPEGKTLDYSDNTCKPCPSSQVFVSTMGACACKAGYEDSGNGCEKCGAGNFSSTVGSTECSQCAPGRFTRTEGETTCTRCAVGFYQDTFGEFECKPCPATLTTNGIGGESIDDCWCGEGTKPGADGKCEECGDPRSSGMNCLGGSNVMVAEGFYAADDSLSVFKCFSDIKRCPGGKPGESCAEGREGISCALCKEGMMEHDDGSCKPCKDDGGAGIGIFVTACIIAVVILAGVYLAIDKQGAKAHSHSVLLCGVVLSLCVTMAQQLGIMFMFSKVTWPEPIRSLMVWVSLLTFDIDVLNLNCIASMSALSMFVSRVVILAVCVGILLMLHVIIVLALYGGRFKERMPSLMGSIGTIFLVFYISVVTTVLGPLQCMQHPNDKWTVRSYPSVICWEGGDHTAMIVIGVFALMVPMAFCTQCCLCVYKFPQMMAQGNLKFLHTYNFLFFRYKPASYWYSLVHIFRSLILANLPIIPSIAAQLIGMQAVLVASLVIVCLSFPWRVDATNKMDMAFTLALLFMVGCAPFYVDEHPGSALAWMSMVVLLLVLVTLPIAGGFALRAYMIKRSQKPFQYFLCHHKGGAGAFARLLKMQLKMTKGVNRQVFIDSDNLVDLDVLFDQVANSTETLIAVCSKSLFLRQWCIGELCTARAKGIDSIRVVLPDFEEPSDEFIENYHEHVTDASILTNRHISMDDVREAIRWTKDLRTVQVSLNLDDEQLRSVAMQVVASSAEPAPKAVADAAKESNTIILRDETNIEATASAMVLVQMLNPLLAHTPDQIPRVAAVGEQVPANVKKIILLCTPGVLEQESVLRGLNSTMKSATVLPIVVDENFRFPVASLLDSHAELAKKVGGSRELLAQVLEIFKTIAPHFPASMAMEMELTTKVVDVANKLKALEGSKPKLSKEPPGNNGDATPDETKGVDI